MKACIRCGRWHDDAEAAEGKKLSCTEVKQYWNRRRGDHNEKFGHFPMVTFDGDEGWFCLTCQKKL